mgnify:CR=1 FL=1
MLFLYIHFPLVFCSILCIFIYLCLSWCHVYSLMSSYNYIVKIIEPYGRRQLLYLSRNFLVILHVWVWVVLGRGGKTGWAQRASPSARAKRNGLGWRFQPVSPFWPVPSSPSTWRAKVRASSSWTVGPF